MVPVNRPTLMKGLVRALTGVRDGTTAFKTAPACSSGSTRSIAHLCSQQPAFPPRSPPPAKSTHAIKRPCSTLRYPQQQAVHCEGLRAFDSQGSRKRPSPVWRSLSTSRSDGSAGRAGSAGGDASTDKVQEDAICWKCESPVDWRDFFCECGAAQLLDGRLDYFEMFGHPPSVFLDTKEVEKKYKNIQRAFHPVSLLSLLPNALHSFPLIVLRRTRPVCVLKMLRP